MEFQLEEGLEYTAEKTVEYKDTAKAFGSGLVEVFATPAMVAFMEFTSHSSISAMLPEGFSSVGIEIHTTHLKATPLGMRVNCHTKLTRVDGKKLYFKVSAYDEEGIIGDGIHVRYIIEVQKFMDRLLKKSN